MAYGTVNADVIGTSVANSNLGAGNATRFKNRIINGDMRIDQRNAGASVTATTTGSNTYLVDRFCYNVSQASKFTAQQNAGSVTPPTSFTNYLGITSSSAYSLGAGDYFVIGQIIEGLNNADLAWGTANAKTITLSFWVYSSLTGTFGGALSNSAQNRSYPYSYTVSSANTWTQVSLVIAGDTSGTWLTTNGIGIRLWFSLGTGSTYSGTSGSWAGSTYLAPTGATSVVGTSGATFYITGVQLEVGSSATGFEYVDMTNQIAMCQRYFEKTYDIATAVATNTNNGIFGSQMSTDGGGNLVLTQRFCVSKRTAPTMTGYRTDGTVGSWSFFTSGTNGFATITFERQATGSFGCYWGGTTAWVAAVGLGHWIASAEL